MSWSINFIGKPEAVIAAIEEHASKIVDAIAKEEFGLAAPHLIALVRLNSFDNIGVILNASGYGFKNKDGKIQSNCSVGLESTYSIV